MVIRGFRDDSVSNHSKAQSSAIEGAKAIEAVDGLSSASSRSSRQRSKKLAAQRQFRRSLIETLETRNLMAGPQLIGVQPNNSDILDEGDFLNVAPRELTFRFNDGQSIDTTTVATGIRVTRAGSDGSFGRSSAATDFGTNGRVEIQLTLATGSPSPTSIVVTKADLGANAAPVIGALVGNTLSIRLNSNTPTTATQLVNAINASSSTGGVLTAEITGGFADVLLGTITPDGFTVPISSTNDQVVPFLTNSQDSVRRQNEVTLRFSDALPDDLYRIELFGFDDASRRINGLKNTNGELFMPTNSSTRQDTLNFRLDLGPRVTGVVPQPVIRNTNGTLQQLRDTIVVYFDNDNLLVENKPDGTPTDRSAENPQFYQLINTQNTIRNTDDGAVIYPTSVTYHAINNTATLKFSRDLSELNTKVSAFRLRIGTRESVPFNAITPLEVPDFGDTFVAAPTHDLGANSIILTSEIKTTDLNLSLDLLGSSSDPGHRDLGPTNFENHINENFGADSNPGITKIYFNFKENYSGQVGQRSNTISEIQKTRIREALATWARYLGVQFTETADLGLTFATGDTGALTGPGVQREPQISMAARIDPSFNSGVLVLGGSRSWNDNYGEDYYRVAMTGIAMLLGLEHGGDLPASNLMAMSTPFLLAAQDRATRNFESVFPGAQDILHGKHIHRPDSSDIDLYRFKIDNGPDRKGFFEAETFAERSETASSLDTFLTLYKQTQAKAASNFNAGAGLSVEFEAIQPGSLGNHVQIFVSRSDLPVVTPGVRPLPVVRTFPNLILVELNSTVGSESTAADLEYVINNDPSAKQLVQVAVRGDGNTKIGDREITYSPIELLGGGIEKIAQNDNYFSEDSLIRLSLGTGTYYIGVSASGNDQYDPNIPNSGTNGRTEGRYELRLKFRAEVAANASIQDVFGINSSDVGQVLDGDGDGTPGGVYNFWFETRPLNRVVTVNAGGSAGLEGQIITLTGANGVTRRLEFSADATVGLGNQRIAYSLASTANDIATNLRTAISAVSSQTGITAAIVSGNSVVLTGERTLSVPSTLTILDIAGKTIFVDKAAGPNADGTQAKPFNNLQNSNVANAFGSALPGDIVRIVGNGGLDGNALTLTDNLAYEFGFGVLPGSVLSDGDALLIPKGVIAMVDAGAIFKARRSRIAVGSSNLDVDRSAAALQILGTPSQNVIFTSWLDESIGRDNFGPRTTPSQGDWGGIIFQRDVDTSAGRSDLEDEGIFLNYVTNADIRFGGGSGIQIDSVEQVVNPIQIVDARPTIIYNRISQSADAAMGATPNSFQETLFTDISYQYNGTFTPDYERVGPDIYGNRLTDNSLNGLFVRIVTLPGDTPRTLSLAGRLNDVDLTYVLTENLLIEGTPGGNILDTTRPSTDFMTASSQIGGSLTPGSTYKYKVTFVDRVGNESIPSDPISVTVGATDGSVNVQGIPGAIAPYSIVRLYRSSLVAGVDGPYRLAAQLDFTRSSFVDRGSDLGGTLLRDQADVSSVISTPSIGGSLVSGVYRYRIVMVDSNGIESIASEATRDFTLNATDITAGNNSLTLSSLPRTQAGFAARNIYRSTQLIGGSFSPFVLAGTVTDNSSSTFNDSGFSGNALAPTAFGEIRSRRDASLVIDPGAVFKIEGSRIEVGQGTQLLAEGTGSLPIIFTSKRDDRTGVGGVADTNNDGINSLPTAGDWGGIYVSPGAYMSLDNTTVAYAGGVTRISGTFRSFNALEIQQGDARVSNSIFENNESGVGGQGPDTRLGRMLNAESVVFARGTQPIFVNNTFVNNQFASNAGNSITIDHNSLNNIQQGDTGRMTGSIDRLTTQDQNRGPLLRGNRFLRNETNGLEIRADNRSTLTANAAVLDIENLASDVLSTESVWDDTDIVHVLRDAIYVNNLQHASGLSLHSTTTESLVIKLDGAGSNFDPLRGTGFYALGEKSSIVDRVGGTIHVIGQPGFPVVLTSLRDDTIGAGLRLDNRPQTDTNDDGIGTIPRAGDWNAILLDQDSNDRNVAVVLESESVASIAPGTNGSTLVAQNLGLLAANALNSDENLRLGFVVKGVLGQPEDQDVYSFSGVAGTEVWIDIDNTSYTLDSVLELLDANGVLLARSDDSTSETAGMTAIVKGSISSDSVNPLNKQVLATPRTNANAFLKEDGTTNLRDAGIRVVLPGAPNVRSNFYFRVRSKSVDINNPAAGLTSGSYQVQVRNREAQEFPGSTVQFADIRYATNGVHLRGLPNTSPLLGEESEVASDNNNPFSYTENRYAEEIGTTGVFRERNGLGIDALGRGSVPTRPIGTDARPQHVGNILLSNIAATSIAGNLASAADIDYYRFSLSEQDIVSPTGQPISLAFDMDYADGLSRPDTSLSLYRLGGSSGLESWQLINFGEDSNIADDRRTPLTSGAIDFAGGSVGTKDPFINARNLVAGEYLIAVTSAARIPNELINPPTTAAPRIIFRNPSTPGAAFPLLRQIQVSPGNSFRVDLRGLTVNDAPEVAFVAAGVLPGDYPLAVNPRFTTTGDLIRDPLNEFPITAGRNTGDLARYLGQIITLYFPTAGQLATGINIPAVTNFEITTVEQPTARRSPASIVSPATGFALSTAAPIRSFPIDLRGSSADDKPAMYFDYNLTSANLRVSARVGGVPTSLSMSLLTDGIGRQEKIDLSAFAGSQFELVFEKSPVAGADITISNFMVGFSERGEIITTSPTRDQNSFSLASGFFAPQATTSTTLSGPYQLEIRRIEDRAITDTNERFSNSVTLALPPAAVAVGATFNPGIHDGNFFTLSDGVRSQTFEFVRTDGTPGTVNPGNVRVAFASTDNAATIANRLIDAINSAPVQSRLNIRAATADGRSTSPITGYTGFKVNLFGNAIVSALDTSSNPIVDSSVTPPIIAPAPTSAFLITNSTNSDQNVVRDQGQVLISNNTITQSRDFGIRSEPGSRTYDPRDTVDTFSVSGTLVDNGSISSGGLLQSRPPILSSSPGPARNLQQLNNSLEGGFATGVFVSNNILDRGGLGGVNIASENPLFMISPNTIPLFDHTTNTELNFGDLIADGSVFVVDFGRSRVSFEFEDLAESAGLGNGWNSLNVPVFYGNDGNTPYSAYEVIAAMRQAVLGSILVTNGTTQNVRATMAMSTLPPIIFPQIDPVGGELPIRDRFLGEETQDWANRPALFLEGITGVYFVGGTGTFPFDVREANRSAAPQSFARVVNNTIIGNDGTASRSGATSASETGAASLAETNDSLATAVQTMQGMAHSPESYRVNGSIGDNAFVRSRASDVDFYQFRLDVGDRVFIDIDTPASSGLNATLQLFDASGRLVNIPVNATTSVTIVDDATAPANTPFPGAVAEAPGRDPFIDFTATVPGVYYVAVSSRGNSSINPRLAGSSNGGDTAGDYSLELTVVHPQTFTITIDEEAEYNNGDLFEIYQIPDVTVFGGVNIKDSLTPRSQTFEFTTFTPATYPGTNTPIFIGAANNRNNIAVPMDSGEIAHAIADAINSTGLNASARFGSALNNRQNLPNDGLAAGNPNNRVSAVLLGGQDTAQPGLRTFPLTRRFATAFRSPDNATRTGQRFIVINNASAIASTPAPIVGEPQRRSVRVDPDFGDTYNMDQVIPETGIFVSGGSSPTLLNNVIYNVQSPIVREETRAAGFGSGTGVDNHPRQSEIIVGGTIYQFAQPVNNATNLGVAKNRDPGVTFPRRIGIEISSATSPSNIPNLVNDFNSVVPVTEQLFVNSQGQQYLPRDLSRLIDSSVDSLTERAAFNTIKSVSGISPSPILAPSRDAYGQLRVDDPRVSPPQGLGANVFKDRGALDRSDRLGPSAKISSPTDNDTLRIDQDSSRNSIKLLQGTYNEFRIQLSDTLDTEDPFPGVGIDDDTVLNVNQPPRLPGAVLSIRENGRTLVEGRDYIFSYNQNNNEIILTPLTGIWRDSSVYEISLNNRDRFVMQVPSSGDQIREGEVFQIRDNLGGTLNLEFESGGYTLQLPKSLELIIPDVGAGLGGIRDGDTFTINDGVSTRTFEMDSDNVFTTGVSRTIVQFLNSDTQTVIASKILASITNIGYLAKILPSVQGSPLSILVGGSRGTTLSVTGSGFTLPEATLGIQVLVSNTPDGQTFTINDGSQTITFEFDSNDTLSNNVNVRVNTSAASTTGAVAQAIVSAIATTTLRVLPEIVTVDPFSPTAERFVHLGLPTSGRVTTVNATPGAQLGIVGVARTINDRETITVTVGAETRTFEFDDQTVIPPGVIPPTVSANNIAIPFRRDDSQAEIAQDLVSAINSFFVGSSRVVGNASVAILGENTTVTKSASTVTFQDEPGISTGTQLSISPIQFAAISVSDVSQIPDNSTFTIVANGVSRTVLFDSNLSDPGLNPNVIVIRYSPSTTTPTQLAALLSSSINQPATGLGLATTASANVVTLGLASLVSLTVLPAGLNFQQESILATDGDFFTISNGTSTATFEFNNTALNNGITVAGRIPLTFSSADTVASLTQQLITTINAQALGITAVANSLMPLVIDIDDTFRTVYDTTRAETVSVRGFAGGVIPVTYIANSTFSSEDIKTNILRAIQKAAADTPLAAGGINLVASDRGGDTLYIENATLINSPQTNNYYLSAIKDLAGNSLRSNRVNNATEFSIVMPGSRLDFGDAPDPATTVAGRYPTLTSSDGARHALVGTDEIQLIGWNSPVAVSGTFTLSFGTNPANTTGAISASATVGEIEAALENLPGIGSGNVIVEQVNLPTASTNVRYRIRFTGTLSATNAIQITINTANLVVPVGSAAIAASQVTEVEGAVFVRLGTLINAELDGGPTPNADFDLGDDGVKIVNNVAILEAFPVFHPILTPVVSFTATGVTEFQPVFISAWIDWNVDGDWDDAGEQMVDGFEMKFAGYGVPVVKSFPGWKIPGSFPQPTGLTQTFMRARISTARSLGPTGFAPDGEVEDYAIQLLPEGTLPTAISETTGTYSLVEDQTGGLVVTAANGVLQNEIADLSNAGLVLTALLLTPPSVGTLTGLTTTSRNDGSFTYIPPADFNGDVTFTYRVFNGILGSQAIATATISVREVNDAPIVPNKNVSLPKNSNVEIDLNEGNSAGPPNESSQEIRLESVASTSVQGGTISLVNGTYIYQPPQNYFGSDSFTYVVTDNGMTNGTLDPKSTTGTVFITITDRNTPPLALSLTVTPNRPEDTPVELPPSFFTNGIDPNDVGQIVSLASVSPTSAAGGTVTIRTDGVVIYTPKLNFTGTDTFTYTLTDTGIPPAFSTGTVTVTLTNTNDTPTQLVPLATITVAEDSVISPVVLSNFFTDPDLGSGDVLAYSIDSNSNPGMVTPSVSTTGQLLLPLVTDQNGTAIIVVRATDRDGLSVTNTLTLVVTPVADPAKSTSPIPGQNVNEDAAPINITLAPTHFVNPDNLGSPATGLTYIASSSNPNLVQTSVVNGVLQLTLQPNAFGTATITVSANNGNGPVTQTFAVNVAAVNDAPTTLADVYSVPANFVLRATDATGSVTVTTGDNGVLANDSDVEGNTFTASVVRQPTRGVLTFNPNGTFTYTPNFGSTAGQSDSFTYRATDSLGAVSLETTVTVNFTATIRSPHQNPDTRWQFAVGADISSPDVNADGFVSPIDALLIINYLNDRNSTTSVPSLTYTPPPFRDVNGDMLISPTDIIQVINFLNARSQGPSGEGESIVAMSSGSVLAAAPAVTGVSTWSTNTTTVGNSLIPMRDVSAVVTPIASGFKSTSIQSTVDLAMSDILSVDSEEEHSEFDFVGATSHVSDSAFDLAISDLFDTSKKKSLGN